MVCDPNIGTRIWRGYSRGSESADGKAYDDLFGFMLYRIGEPAVTRHLGVDYLGPVLFGTPYELRAPRSA